MVWRQKKEEDLQFAVVFENLFKKPGGALYGIIRSTKEVSIEKHVNGDRILSDEMTERNGFHKNHVYPGYKYLAKLNLNRFDGDKESILALHEDNLNEGHLFAEVLASLMWQLFDKYRHQLEELNQRYPY